MEELVYTNNIDYELCLFAQDYPAHQHKYLKIVKNYEYVFLFIEKGPCHPKNLVSYQPDYLRYLKDLGFAQNIQLNPCTQSPPHAWWGSLTNIPLEQELNSKITSTALAQKLGMALPSTQIIHQQAQLLEYLENSPHESFILKNPYLMAGRGNTFLTLSADEKNKVSIASKIAANKKLTFPLIIEKKLTILAEVSSYFQMEQNQFNLKGTYCNLVDSHGTHRGSVYHPEEAKLLGLFQKNAPSLMIPLKQIKKSHTELIQHYQMLGATSGMSIDSFIYQDQVQDQEQDHGQAPQAYLLGEINYRKAMGLMLFSLAHLNLTNRYLIWKIYPKIRKHRSAYGLANFLQHLHPILFHPQQKRGIILTSPLQDEINHLSLYYIVESLTEFIELEEFFLHNYLNNPFQS